MRRRTSPRGLTLVEVMVAMSLVAVATLALVSANTIAARYSSRSYRHHVAMRLGAGGAAHRPGVRNHRRRPLLQPLLPSPRGDAAGAAAAGCLDDGRAEAEATPGRGRPAKSPTPPHPPT